MILGTLEVQRVHTMLLHPGWHLDDLLVIASWVGPPEWCELRCLFWFGMSTYVFSG